MSDVQGSGFKRRTRVAAARERLLETRPIDRTERVSLSYADGRTVAEPVRAARAVPHYPRAAMDGWAVRAEDTFGAADRSPVVLRPARSVRPGTAVRVHTGSELPDGADAVVMVEQTDLLEGAAGGGSRDGVDGQEATDRQDAPNEDQDADENGDADESGELEVFDAVAAGENVAPVGEDVEDGQLLYGPGHQLRPSDLGMLKGAGVDEVEVVARPTVAVVPTGEELVQTDPAPGQTIETNRLTVARLAERWGADVTRRDVVTDDPAALRAAVERDLTRDVVVTTGGSSVGERDLVPEVVADRGEVLVHGVALKPGHPVALGRVDETPVVMLPGYPVAAIVNAVQFLRPLCKHLGQMPLEPLPSREATLSRKVHSEPGVRTFVRVQLVGTDQDGPDETDERRETDEGREGHEEREADEGSEGDEGGDGTLRAVPTRASGSGVLSSVALADGWVVVPESSEGLSAGETVDVEDWEYHV